MIRHQYCIQRPALAWPSTISSTMKCLNLMLIISILAYSSATQIQGLGEDSRTRTEPIGEFVALEPIDSSGSVESAERLTHGSHTQVDSIQASNVEMNSNLKIGQETATKTRLTRRLKSSSLPEFAAPIANVTAVLGRDVRLICTVDNLGQYQVAWLKMETKTIISIDTNIIITNYRIFLIPDEEERKWVLHIKDVQESDRGYYQCQINTNPMRSTSGYLEVVVPPSINESQTSQSAEVNEHKSVTIQCKATGHPRPSISWRREDGQPIRLDGGSSWQPSDDESAGVDATDAASQSQQFGGQTASSPPMPSPSSGSLILPQLSDIRSDRLSLQNVDRSMAGYYVCTASNGIPTQAVKRIPIFVTFPPKTSVETKVAHANPGDQLEFDCLIEAYPKANVRWFRRSQVSTPSWQLDSGASFTHEKQELEVLTGYGASEPDTRMVMSRHLRPRRSPDGTIDDEGQQVNTTIVRQMPRSRVSFVQTNVNSTFIKLTLTIAKVQPDDFGLHYCSAFNARGSSESIVSVMRKDLPVDRRTSLHHQVSHDYRSATEKDYQGDLLEQRTFTQQNMGTPIGKMVYDSEYLQAIKSRLNGNGTVKLPQRHKLRQRGNNGIKVYPSTTMLLFIGLLTQFLIRQMDPALG